MRQNQVFGGAVEGGLEVAGGETRDEGFTARKAVMKGKGGDETQRRR